MQNAIMIKKSLLRLISVNESSNKNTSCLQLLCKNNYDYCAIHIFK
jgi:hypothetical protein